MNFLSKSSFLVITISLILSSSISFAGADDELANATFHMNKANDAFYANGDYANGNFAMACKEYNLARKYLIAAIQFESKNRGYLPGVESLANRACATDACIKQGNESRSSCLRFMANN